MTPNAGVIVCLIVAVSAALAGRPSSVAMPVTAALAIGLTGARARLPAALARTAVVVLPLAAFLAAIWIGLVGRSPAEIAAGVAGSRQAAFAHVLLICGRLCAFMLIVQVVAACFHGTTPLAFVRGLTAPLVIKKLVIMTLSLIDTILHAVDRARAALIASGLMTRRFSLRNFANVWLLIQTVWLTAISIALARLRDKWPIEDTTARLDQALAAGSARSFARSDWGFMALAAAGAVGMLAVG